MSSEQIKYGGQTLAYALTIVYNRIVELEYIPVNFRRGIQVPLYKGKNTCQLDVNNYRGITLLTNFNKIFEMLIWGRMEKWWVSRGVISGLQGACKKGQSCVHTAFLLKETVSHALETNKNVFVTYFDVSKAFDTVWTNGLFYKLYQMGVRGRVWRLLYRAYNGFLCSVRIAGSQSDWYEMQCGIHQGGFLSLIKYTAFVNALIVSLQESGLCCGVHSIPTCPPSYADDIATACLSKLRTDRVLDIVSNYGNKWRFNFNAKKSAILIYGEGKRDHYRNSPDRVFCLGKDRVPEKSNYDHVGVKSMIFNDDASQVSEKIAKARRALNATAGLGIRKNGLTMKTCNIIYWSVIIPILTFGSEIWHISATDYDALIDFQIYTGRRLQRFPARSPRSSSFYGLGWVRVTTFIMIKQMLFIMTILRLKEDNVIRRMFCVRSRDFVMNDTTVNVYRSPTCDMLNTAKRFGLLKVVTDMIEGNLAICGKKAWAKKVWEKAWLLEDVFWDSSKIIHKDNDLLYGAVGHTRYMAWWKVADFFPPLIRMCENLAKLVCHASYLKCDDPRLKGMSHSNRACPNCDMYLVENVFHVVMQCPMHATERRLMYTRLYEYDPLLENLVTDNPSEVFYWSIGGEIPDMCEEYMYGFWCITGQAIYGMYRKICGARQGIG